MLYWLLYLKLFHYFPPFRIFRYLTFRTGVRESDRAFYRTDQSVHWLSIGSVNFRLVNTFAKKVPRLTEKAGTPTMGGLFDCHLHSCSDVIVGRP